MKYIYIIAIVIAISGCQTLQESAKKGFGQALSDSGITADMKVVEATDSSVTIAVNGGEYIRREPNEAVSALADTTCKKLGKEEAAYQSTIIEATATENHFLYLCI